MIFKSSSLVVLGIGEYVICVNDDFRPAAFCRILKLLITCGIFQKCNMALMAVIVLEHPVPTTAWYGLSIISSKASLITSFRSHCMIVVTNH